ncbi:hypothetical protein GW571_13105 [Clavibacter capsici]|uniref:hypothetical protein n=2 Tax=Clavibacter capsici TaxID=1874630 RepID=UPI0014282541|nr:hypothetical protein [Clavibacter capsici]QIS43002.1 hypothetical protein GW571_13105 [Clavibacter capsici]
MDLRDPARAGHFDEEELMGIWDAPAERESAVRSVMRWRLAELDLQREVRRLLDAGAHRDELAKGLRLFGGDDLRRLDGARDVAMPVEGFSGATPLEICERYAVGLLDREQLVDELTRFPYVPMDKPDGWDDLVVNPPGTWMDLSIARGEKLIGMDVYGEVLDRVDTSGD